jgi:excisionase family DNA binding protein
VAKSKKDPSQFVGVWHTIGEVAEMCGMSVDYIESAKNDGSLPHYKFGKSVRFARKTLRRSSPGHAA